MLVVMVGLPGSGKTTFAEANFRTIVSPDRIRLDEFGTRFRREDEPAVWRRAYARTERYLGENRVVCFDATSVTPRRRRALIARARAIGKPAVAIWLDVPAETARRRNEARPDPVPRAAFEQLAGAIRPPRTDEGFAAVLRITS